MAGTDSSGTESEAALYYKAYEGYEKTLRTWFVAYGIGGPILLLTNESVRDAFAHSARGRAIGLVFLIGVALQVLLAIVNKTVAWANYFAANRPEVQSDWKYRAASWVSEQYWLDGVADVATVVAFSWATWAAFMAVTGVA